MYSKILLGKMWHKNIDDPCEWDKQKKKKITFDEMQYRDTEKESESEGDAK